MSHGWQALLDRLYEECIARAGGALRGLLIGILICPIAESSAGKCLKKHPHSKIDLGVRAC